MITRDDADRIREQLLAALAEDAPNSQRLLSRLESITSESGIGAHAALMLILTQLSFEESDARENWEAILNRRDAMTRALGRDPGVRVALLDHFTHVNRKLVEPMLIDLTLTHPEHRESGTDAATGLVSDRRFRAVLQTELRRARRYGQRTGLVVVDIDDFAEANRRFGRLICDRLLRELAILLNNNVRDIDTAARLGEDEMALLLPETDRNNAWAVAERFRAEVEQFFSGRESNGRPVRLTVSAGVACFPYDATAPQPLLERAAQALYHAKAGGGNAVELFSSERRRYVRFDLDPGRFEIEVLGSAERRSGWVRNYSRVGVLFASDEALEVGESIEIRLREENPDAKRVPGMRGRVVRLEEFPEDAAASAGRFEVGVALEETAHNEAMLRLLESASREVPGWPA